MVCPSSSCGRNRGLASRFIEDAAVNNIFKMTEVRLLDTVMATAHMALPTPTRRAVVLLSIIPDLTALIAYAQLYLAQSGGTVALPSTYGLAIRSASSSGHTRHHLSRSL